MPEALEVRVHPKSKRNGIELIEGRKLRITVTAPPEEGKANDAVISLLAKRLGVAKGSVQILSGHKSRNKLLLVEGLALDEVVAILSNISEK
ncbi:MAG: DUF167 domain-containing protein [Chloroflexi bacterium]|nr:DUF167 domain-containing protein [Chloroflexota bacterium]